MKIFTIGRGFVMDHLNYPNIDVRLDFSIKQINEILDEYKPDVLINCIGKTGRPNVDWCESNKEETAMANITLPLMLADACARRGTHLIQLGSGCIFFGRSPNAHNKHTSENIKMKPPEVSMEEWHRFYVDSYQYKKDEWTWTEPGWKETDFANPKSFYSKTKYACDLVLGQMSHVTTLRLRMPISDRDTPRNFINKIRGYQKLIDIPNSVTFLDDLTRCIEWVAENRPGGIFHVTNPQSLTAVRVINEFKKYVPEHKFEIMSEIELNQTTKALRSNCILSTQKLTDAGFKMTNSEEALVKCMASYINNLGRTYVK